MSASDSRRTAAGLAARLAVGLVFAVSGFGKLTAPVEEFAAVIETYRVLPAAWIGPTAAVLPWIEAAAGLFLLAGHRTRAAAAAAAAMLAAFTALLLSASARGLELDRCGCFGSLVRLTPRQAAAVDIVMLALSLVALRWGGERLSLDRWLDAPPSKEKPR